MIAARPRGHHAAPATATQASRRKKWGVRRAGRSTPAQRFLGPTPQSTWHGTLAPVIGAVPRPGGGVRERTAHHHGRSRSGRVGPAPGRHPLGARRDAKSLPPSVGPLDREPCTHSAYPRSEALHSGRRPSAHPTRETHHVPRSGRYPVRPSAVSRRYARRGHRSEQDDGIVPTRILTNGMMNRNNYRSILEKSCAKVTKIPTFYQHVVPSFAHSSARRHARTAPFAVARAARK